MFGTLTNSERSSCGRLAVNVIQDVFAVSKRRANLGQLSERIRRRPRKREQRSAREQCLSGPQQCSAARGKDFIKSMKSRVVSHSTRVLFRRDQLSHFFLSFPFLNHFRNLRRIPWNGTSTAGVGISFRIAVRMRRKISTSYGRRFGACFQTGD